MQLAKLAGNTVIGTCGGPAKARALRRAAEDLRCPLPTCAACALAHARPMRTQCMAACESPAAIRILLPATKSLTCPSCGCLAGAKRLPTLLHPGGAPRAPWVSALAYPSTHPLTYPPCPPSSPSRRLCERALISFWRVKMALCTSLMRPFFSSAATASWTTSGRGSRKF